MAGDLAAVPTVGGNFPKHRGLAIGLAKSFVGLSGALATQYYAGIFKPQHCQCSQPTATTPRFPSGWPSACSSVPIDPPPRSRILAHQSLRTTSDTSTVGPPRSPPRDRPFPTPTSAHRPLPPTAHPDDTADADAPSLAAPLPNTPAPLPRRVRHPLPPNTTQTLQTSASPI